jgi:hypothetical protein
MDIVNIGIGVVCWIETDEQLPELKRCLDSLQSFYPVFVINGKWNDMSGNNPRSTDKANDLIDSYSNIIHISSPNQPEFVNRNKYLELAMKYNLDYLMWVDSDEWIDMPLGKDFFIKGIEDTFKDKQEMCAYIHCYSSGRGGPFRTQKLYHYPGFLRHRLKHNELFFIEHNVWENPLPAPRGMIVNHEKDLRPELKKQQMLNRRNINPIH